MALTMLAGRSIPARRTLATKPSRLACVVPTHAAVPTGLRRTRVVHHLTVEAAEAIRASAKVLVGRGVLAGASVLARLVGAAVIQIYTQFQKNINNNYTFNLEKEWKRGKMIYCI